MKSSPQIAVLYHIFYEDTIDTIAAELESLRRFQPMFFFNINAETPNALGIKQALRATFPGSIVTLGSNKGKDIGGKLVLLNACMVTGMEPDWILFLHDKKSLQSLNSKAWKADLLKIISNDSLDEIERIISEQKTYGIIATQGYVVEEPKEKGTFTGMNGRILDQLVREYGIDPKTYKYVAGTMFWANAAALMSFFKTHNPLAIRQTLEEGNVLDNFGGTVTHAWERTLCWIILAQGLEIKTI